MSRTQLSDFSLFTLMRWRRKWQPTPVFLPGESQERGAWWAAVSGVTQSQTRLKWLSSSSSSENWAFFFFFFFKELGFFWSLLLCYLSALETLNHIMITCFSVPAWLWVSPIALLPREGLSSFSFPLYIILILNWLFYSGSCMACTSFLAPSYLMLLAACIHVPPLGLKVCFFFSLTQM